MVLGLKHYSIIFTTIGITILYIISQLVQPSVVELYQLPNFEDKQVIVTGNVTNFYSTQYNNQMITIKDHNSTALIFSELEIDNLEYGDKIKATGKCQKYNDEYEIIVNNPRFIKIVEKWQNKSKPLWQLSQKPQNYIGININTTGYVDAIYDNYFYLTDNQSQHTILVYYNKYDNNKFIQTGQKIIVHGTFNFESENLRYIITTFNEKHKIIEIGE